METTLRVLLKKTALQFEESGIESPRLTAELLLTHVLGKERVELFLEFDRKILNGELKKFESAVEKRLRGEPVHYITGEAGFMGLTLKIRKGVFIPRPETESLCEEVLKRIQSGGAPLLSRGHETPPVELVVFEIGCGSGALSLSIASHLKTHHPSHIAHYQFYASDISDLALEVSRENSRRLELSLKVEFLKGNLFEPFRSLKRKAHVILSNPPYIPSSLIRHLPLEIRNYEPREAIDGGKDGLFFLRKIVEESPLFLNPGGILALEGGEGQAHLLQDLLHERNDFTEVEIFKDLAGFRRGVIAVKK